MKFLELANHFVFIIHSQLSEAFQPFEKPNGEDSRVFFVQDGLSVISPVITLTNRNPCLICIFITGCLYGTKNRANGWERLAFLSFRDLPSHSHTYSGSSYSFVMCLLALVVLSLVLIFSCSLFCLVKQFLMFV